MHIPEHPKKSSIFESVLSKSKLSDVIYVEYAVQFETLLKAEAVTLVVTILLWEVVGHSALLTLQGHSVEHEYLSAIVWMRS